MDTALFTFNKIRTLAERKSLIKISIYTYIFAIIKNAILHMVLHETDTPGIRRMSKKLLIHTPSSDCHSSKITKKNIQKCNIGKYKKRESSTCTLHQMRDSNLKFSNIFKNEIDVGYFFNVPLILSGQNHMQNRVFVI